MATIVTRSGKGSALTHAEMDSNWNNLNDGKVEETTGLISPTATAGTGTAYTLNLEDFNGTDVTPNTNEVFSCRIHTDNTGAATINVNAAGAVSILDLAGDTLEAGMLRGSTLVRFLYDGTNYIILNPKPPEIADYVVADTIYIWNGDDPAATGVFDIKDNVTQGGSFESIGPTGAGADNTWDDLDDLPSNTAYIDVLCVVRHFIGSAEDDSITAIYAKQNGVSAVIDTRNTIHSSRLETSASGDRLETSNMARIAVTGANVFDVAYTQTETGVNTELQLYLRGFGVLLNTF